MQIDAPTKPLRTPIAGTAWVMLGLATLGTVRAEAGTGWADTCECCGCRGVPPIA